MLGAFAEFEREVIIDRRPAIAGGFIAAPFFNFAFGTPAPPPGTPVSASVSASVHALRAVDALAADLVTRGRVLPAPDEAGDAAERSSTSG